MPEPSKIPQLSVDKREVVGWDKLNLWGCCNNGTWRRASSEAGWLGVNEVDSLRLMAYYLLRDNEELRNRTTNMQLRGPQSIVILDKDLSP